ncbi:MAG TPA: DUF3006 domain-containing protein [Epulopiscium sp.]|nr:DUF3006 domain-containing protein [Candidatus Epulonipiscium sp.]
MRIVIDRIEEEVAVIEKEDGSFVNMSKRLIPPEAKEGDVLQITVDRSSTVDRVQEITSLMDELWESDGDER